MDSGETAKSMALDDTLLPTRTTMRENLLMEIDLGKAAMHGLMEVSMRGIGSVTR